MTAEPRFGLTGLPLVDPQDSATWMCTRDLSYLGLAEVAQPAAAGAGAHPRDKEVWS